MAKPSNRKVKIEMEVEGLADPQFLIEVDGVYYLTLAVWAFDPKAPHLTHQQVEDVAYIQTEFHRLSRTELKCSAVRLPRDIAAATTAHHQTLPVVPPIAGD